MLNRKNLEIYKNTTKTYELWFTKNGAGTDITGWTIFFTVKENMKDADISAKIKKDITSHDDATSGKTSIELSATDTALPAGNYYYDIKYLDDDGNQDIILSGRLRIVDPVTQRTS